jgi:hypothetical protein
MICPDCSMNDSAIMHNPSQRAPNFRLAGTRSVHTASRLRRTAPGPTPLANTIVIKPAKLYCCQEGTSWRASASER